MTEWRTVNIPKKFKEEVAEHIEDTSYSSEKDFIIHATRRLMEDETTEEKIREILREEGLI